MNDLNDGLSVNDKKAIAMNNVAKLYPKEPSYYCGPASVMALTEGDDAVRICLLAFNDKIEVNARLTVPMMDSLSIGDEVLVTGDVFGELYVIGLLASPDKQAETVRTEKLDIGNGAYALVDGESSAFKLFSKRNELLIEFDPESETARINIESGDLEFTTGKGDIVLNSANNIQLKGQNIELAGQSGIQLGVLDSIGQKAASFSLAACQASLNSAKLRVTAQLGEFQLKEARVLSTRFRGKIEDAQLVADRVSTVANTVTEKAQNVYRTVEQLAQLKAGRMRTLVASTFHLKAKKTTMKSQEDFKVNAEKIHLG